MYRLSTEARELNHFDLPHNIFDINALRLSSIIFIFPRHVGTPFVILESLKMLDVQKSQNQFMLMRG